MSETVVKRKFILIYNRINIRTPCQSWSPTSCHGKQILQTVCVRLRSTCVKVHLRYSNSRAGL